MHVPAAHAAHCLIKGSGWQDPNHAHLQVPSQCSVSNRSQDSCALPSSLTLPESWCVLSILCCKWLSIILNLLKSTGCWLDMAEAGTPKVLAHVHMYAPHLFSLVQQSKKRVPKKGPRTGGKMKKWKKKMKTKNEKMKKKMKKWKSKSLLKFK